MPARRLMRFADRWIPESLRADLDQQRRARLLLRLTFNTTPAFVVSSLLYGVLLPGPVAPWLAAAVFLPVPFSLAVGPLLWRTGSLRVPLRVFLGAGLAMLTIVVSISGGAVSQTLFWYALLPSVAQLICGWREALRWAAASLVSLAGFAVLGARGFELAPDVIQSAPMRLLQNAGMLSVVFLFFLPFERMNQRATATLRKAHLAFTAARADAERASQEKSEFLSRMSHRIRTPLMAILGFGELLLEGAKSCEEDLEALHTMNRNAQHLLRIVDDMLDLSRVESDTLEIAAVPLDPLDVVRDVAELMRVRAEGKGLRLIVEADGDVPSAIVGDPTRLRQTLLNLLGNAIKFTARGHVRLHVRASAREDRIRFLVEDTGIGMSADELTRLFQPFVQANDSTARLYGGSGLGLVISRRLVDAMGGTIHVESQPGVGTRFEVDLPVGNAAAAGAAESRAAQAQVARAALDRHVLVVDDTADNRVLLERLLRRAGARVTLACGGLEALEQVARLAEPGGAVFDLILMDLQMPDMDGYATVDRLRADGYRGRIVALTADAMLQTRDRCLGAGFDGFATKPIGLQRLIQVVRGEEGGAVAPPEPRPAAEPAAAPSSFGERLAACWERSVRYFIPEALREDPETFGRAQMVVACSFVPAVMMPVLAWLSVCMLPPVLAVSTLGLLLVGVPLMGSMPFVMRASGSTAAPTHALHAYSLLMVALSVGTTGGIFSYNAPFLVLLPVTSMATLGPRAGYAWLLSSGALLAGFGLLQGLGVAVPDVSDPTRQMLAYFVVSAVLTWWLLFVAIVYDTSTRCAIERLSHSVRAASDARDQSERASESKGRFLATLSHEMRTPMTALLGFSDLLRERWEDDPGQADARTSLETVRRNGVLLLGMINDLLDLSRLDAGRLPLERMPLSPAQLLEDLARQLGPEADARGTTLLLSVDPALPLWIQEDPVRVRQILEHLVRNALQWSRGRTVSLAVAPAAREGMLAWTVADDGCGLPDRDAERLFHAEGERSVQPIANTGSAGLGVRLCRRLAFALDGTLSIETREGQGTRLQLCLPLRVASQPGLSLEPVAQSDPQTDLLQARLLVVEDSPDNQRLIAHVLRSAGAEVDVASNGADAIERVTAAAQAGAGHDLVLMDMQLPVMDGETATRELRRLGFARPILALTARTRAEARERCLAAGCDEVVSKPIERRELIAAIARALRS